MSGESRRPRAQAPDWLELAYLSELWAHDGALDLAAAQAAFPGFEKEIARLHARAETSPPSRLDTRKLGRFRLLEELGRGAQGIVYRAHDPSLGRDVVLKQLLAPGGNGSEASRMRWARELRLAARIDHPGVCRLLEFGREDGRSYATFPFVEGCTLQQLLESTTSGAEVGGERAAELSRAIGLGARQRGQPLAPLLLFFEKLARAVHSIHRHDVVHRDLKPANVLVRANGTPLILDLGLAGDQRGEELSLTDEGRILGTPAYIPPERLRDRSDTEGSSSDLWALGVILFECLFLRRPFEAATREGLFQRVLTEDPDFRALGRGWEAGALRGLLWTALSKEPARRYQSAEALAEDLRRVRAREPLLARRPRAWERCALWVRRRPWLSSAIAGTLLGLLSTIVVLVLLLGERTRSAAQMRLRHVALGELASDLMGEFQIALARVPGTAELRHRLLQRSHVYLQQMEQEGFSDPLLLWKLFEVHVSSAQVLGNAFAVNLGDYERADEHLEAARDILGRLQNSELMTRDVRSRSEAMLALAHAGLEHGRGHLAAAREYWLGALSHLDSMEQNGALGRNDLSLAAEI